MAPRTLMREIEAMMATYPNGRSATLPALRLAQERYGWLSPEALREVADALGTTPAYCHSVASFYDMFHLAPVGRHLVEVCTNISCALVGVGEDDLLDLSRHSRATPRRSRARRLP